MSSENKKPQPKQTKVKFDRIEGEKVVYKASDGREARIPLTAAPFRHNIELDDSLLKKG